MTNLEIGARIKARRTELGLTLDDIAGEIGVAKSTIQRYEKGTIDKLKLPVIEAIARTLHVNPSWLIGKSSDASESPASSVHSSAGNVIKVPVLGRVAAGIPIEAIEDIIDYEELSANQFGDGEYFALQIKGHSMEPKISDGDVVIVRRQENADTGNIVVVLVNGDEATVKKIKLGPQGITLIPNNPAFEPIFYSNKEIEDLPVKVIGRVVELRAKF